VGGGYIGGVDAGQINMPVLYIKNQRNWGEKQRIVGKEERML